MQILLYAAPALQLAAVMYLRDGTHKERVSRCVAASFTTVWIQDDRPICSMFGTLAKDDQRLKTRFCPRAFIDLELVNHSRSSPVLPYQIF
jgi:hypothetical protein